MSEKLHVFNFAWGYVETSRIAQLPNFVHIEGFDTPMEAAKSFKQLLLAICDKAMGCPEHGRHIYKHCPGCGKATKQIKGSEEEAYDLFDSFYTQECDGCPARYGDYEEWDENWLWEWETNRDFLKTAKITHVLRFNRYLYDEEDEPIFQKD